MSFLQAAGLAVRLFSLWLFLFAFQSAAAMIALRNSSNYSLVELALLCVPSAAAVIFGLLLWRFPFAVARLLVPRTSDTATAITLRECWRLASVAIGLLVLAEAAPLLMQSMAILLYNIRHDFEALTAPLQGTLVAAGSKTVFALFLIFGNNAIYRRFGELRQER